MFCKYKCPQCGHVEENIISSMPLEGCGADDMECEECGAPTERIMFGVAGTINRFHFVQHPWYKRLWFWLRRKPLRPIRVIDDITVDSYSLLSCRKIDRHEST